jgi:hypothetical protein
MAHLIGRASPLFPLPEALIDAVGVWILFVLLLFGAVGLAKVQHGPGLGDAAAPAA